MVKGWGPMSAGKTETLMETETQKKRVEVKGTLPMKLMQREKGAWKK